MPVFYRRWFVVCVAWLLLGAYAPQVSGQQSRCVLCTDQCQQKEAKGSHRSDRPADHSPPVDGGGCCDQCPLCHAPSAQLPPALTVPEAEWTSARVDFIEWKEAAYGSPFAEIDHPPQLS